MELLSGIRDTISSSPVERTLPITILDDEAGLDFTWDYTDRGDNKSPFKEGGYIIEFDRDKIANTTGWRGM